MARRVALIMQAGAFAGPALSAELARREHDLMLHAPRPGQADVLRAQGARVEVMDGQALPAHGPGSADTAEGCEALVQATLDAFGALNAASLQPSNMSDHGFVRGALLEASLADVRAMSGYIETTFNALRALIPAMRRQGGGQILVFTSGAGLRPAPGWSLYGAARAGQNFFLRAVALEHARDDVMINAICSKNAISPDFPIGVHGEADPPAGEITDDHLPPGRWQAPIVEEVPLGRPGTMAELAWFSAALLDGRNRFQTGQCFGFTGGWEVA